MKTGVKEAAQKDLHCDEPMKKYVGLKLSRKFSKRAKQNQMETDGKQVKKKKKSYFENNKRRIEYNL